MKKKKRIIFNITSILFLLTLVVFYGYRLFYYYMLEHKNYENKIVLLYEKLIDNKGINGTDKGLITKDNSYIYASKSDDNYLYYAGRLWRIISIDENNNIKLITDDIQTLLTWKNTDEFINSNINNWLNRNETENTGIFENSLGDEVNDLMKQNNLVATLLKKEDFELLNKNNYLVNGKSYWIISESNLPAYIDSNGNINNDIEDSDFYGVRPVIVLSSNVIWISGNGTKDNPYIISDIKPEKLNGTFVGEYVNFSGLTWRIIENNSDSIKIALDGTLDDTVVFSKYDNVYSLKEGIGLYLNNEFYNDLQNNDYIVPIDYYNGAYTQNNEYNYLNKYSSSVKANVGLYSLGDFFLNENEKIYTLTPYLNAKKTIYTINENGRIFADFIDSEYKIRPIISIDSNLFIIDGNGTKEKPYEIGR